MELDALRTLYEAKQDALKVLSTRSFTTTLQSLALDVAVLAGLIGGKITLTDAGKIIATITIFAFNAAVIFYLISKSIAHHREKEVSNEIEAKLKKMADVPNDLPNASSYCCSFMGGTFPMIICVLIASAAVITGFWLKL